MALDPRQVEVAVLHAVVELHPEHLTPEALVLRLAGQRNEGAELRAAIERLKAVGLLEDRADAVVPTEAALHATALLTL